MSTKLMDLSTEGVVTGRIQSKVENISNIPKNNEYLETIKIITTVSNQFKKAHDTDAGFDILTNVTGHIEPGKSMLVPTGLKVEIPKGYVGIIKSRSGLSVKHGIDIGAGVIDSGYRGEIKVLMRNTADTWFDYQEGMKIAQMVIVPICPFKVLKVSSLESTDRGDGGFGSTGV